VSTEPVVRAAGGVVVRAGRDEPEILIVHRPRYDDWSLPKGKLEQGEDAADAALREVEEETAYRCRLGPEIASVRYRDQRGRPKEVRYWRMDVEREGTFRANDEVDQRRWLTVRDAVEALTHDSDREVVAQFARRLESA
jgi:8-oxo-dGTP diphosphatase